MDVATWLHDLGLGQYLHAFEVNDVDTQTLPRLNEADLIDIGVTSVGHRRKLAAAIAQLGEVQNQAPVSSQTQRSVRLPSHAEYRQISVLCCDMVGSTALSAQLDPEDYRALIQAFHKTATGTVKRHDGFLANFIGDCVLAYFGWPRAREGDAERAVRAGIGLIEAIDQLNTQLKMGVAVRIGIATGKVMIGDLLREGPAQEHSAIGESPYMSAQLQASAKPGQVVIDDLTKRLLGDGYATQCQGSLRLMGFDDPVTAWTVVGKYSAKGRFDAHRGRELTPMVGRDVELALLRKRWAKTRDGEGAGVLLVGEAGIGKSRVVHALLDACAYQPHEQMRWHCSPYHTGSALWPEVQRLAHAAGLEAHDSPEAALDKLEAVATTTGKEATALYATLLGLKGVQRYGPLEMPPQLLRERTLELLVEQIFELAEQRPLLLLVEDAHWIDPTTLEVLERCLEKIERARLLVVITSRPDNAPVLAMQSSMMHLSLNRLGRASVEAIVTGLAGNALQPQTLTTIVDQTDGVPLFVEELTKAVLETGEAAIPASLHGSLMARLDSVPDVREVAQMAACIGREFDQALLEAVADTPRAVGPAIDRLLEAELVFRRTDRSSVRYIFKHALVQETAHESLLHSRRTDLHGRILRVLESERLDTPREILAHHAQAARLADKAIVHWHEAGNSAQAKSAYVEAARFLDNAIALIQAQADGLDRRPRELELQLAIAQVRMATFGVSSESTRQAYHRANELLKSGVRNLPARFPVQYGLWTWHYVRAELKTALQLALETLEGERAEGTPESLLFAQRMLATTYTTLGDLAKAQALYEQALPLVNSDKSREMSSRLPGDQRIATLYQYSLMRCIQGHADQSRRLIERAYGLCTALTPGLLRAYLHLTSAIRASFGRDASTVSTELSAVAELAGKHRMLPMFDGFIDIFSVWEAIDGGKPAEDDIARYLRGLKRVEASGRRLYLPFFMARLADGMAACQRHDEAWLMIERSAALCEETAQGWCDAEVWRVRGELLLRAPRRDELRAARCFEKAQAQALLRGAHLWELRAAVSLARLRLRQKRPSDALSALAPTYERFTEGFDTVDLAEARTLLSELNSAMVSP